MDTVYLEKLIQSDKTRKLRNFMLYHFYQNDIQEIKSYLMQYMLGASLDEATSYWIDADGIAQSETNYKGIGLFSPETASMMPKFHRDVTNKALNNICTSYHTGIDRYLIKDDGEIDQEQTDLLNKIYKDAGANLFQKEWYRQGKLFNIVEVKPVWRKKPNKLEFDIWTPNFFTVEMDSESYLYKEVILFDTIADINGEEKDVKEVWTNDEHFYLVFKDSVKVGFGNESKWLDQYEKVPVPDNPDMINPYGVIPSQELRFKIGQDYYGEGMFDLIEDNIWHDVRENNSFFVEMFQGLGILYAVNMGKSGKIAIQPFSINAVNNVANEMKDPKIESVATNAPLSELRENAKNNVQQILMMKGLSSQAGTVDNQNATGISKAIDMDELEMQKADDELILSEFEEKLFEKVRIIHNYHATDKLSEDLKFVCRFNKKKTTLNTQDWISKWTFELERGLKNEVDYLTEDNPSITVKEAERQIEDNLKKRNERINNTNPNRQGIDNKGQQGQSGSGNNVN